MQTVKFYFDPRCPWCYQTSKWAKRLEQLGEINLDWGVFSLEVLNIGDDVDPMSLTESGSPQLRTAIAIARRHGSPAIGPYYTELGARTFEQSEPTDADQTHDLILSALTAADLEPDLLHEALDDASTWQEVVETTIELYDRVGDVGVPTIVLDGGSGPAIFGPVIVAQPDDDDAIELWRHTEWLTRYTNFAELKRKRSGQPDLPMIRYRERHQRA